MDRPDGGSIAAGEYQTVALAGSAAFLSKYGVAPTYELFDDGSNDGEAKMLGATSGSINGQGGLTDSGEVVILYYWDGATDLVTDLDYALWGDKAEAVDKTGVSIDGPDADSDPSPYRPDTAIADQDFIAAGAHASGDSWQRLDLSEGTETQVDGNGVGGDDETSEDLSATWCESTPTPGEAESCSAPPPPPPPSPTVFINEIHYDNSGSDTGEAVEIAGPAGTDLTNWTVALYNGSSSQRKVYDTIPLEGTIPDQTGDYGTLAFPRADIQNGSPDGLALLEDSGALLQFLCYEGTFVAASGPAAGEECTDIGLSEPGSTSVGFSLQLTGRGTTASEFSWEGPSPSSFGAVNSGQCFGDGPCGTGAASPDLVGIGEESLLAVTVDPGVNPPSEGLVVTCDLSTIGGSPSQNFYDDGSNGDSVAGDNVFSFKAIPTVDTAVSSNSFPCDISDDQSRSGSASINLDVIVPIGTVQ